MSTAMIQSADCAQNTSEKKTPGAATFVVFSGEMDRTLAAFNLATTAAASGMKTTIFFTFWGLSAIRARGRRSRGLPFLDRLFGAMIPKGHDRLPTSKLNFLGLGPHIFRWRMGRKKQAGLQELVEQARALGIEMIACEASANVLGIRPEEFIDGVSLGGAMSCMRAASQSEVSMFI